MRHAHVQKKRPRKCLGVLAQAAGLVSRAPATSTTDASAANRKTAQYDDGKTPTLRPLGPRSASCRAKGRAAPGRHRDPLAHRQKSGAASQFGGNDPLKLGRGQPGGRLRAPVRAGPPPTPRKGKGHSCRARPQRRAGPTIRVGAASKASPPAKPLAERRSSGPSARAQCGWPAARARRRRGSPVCTPKSAGPPGTGPLAQSSPVAGPLVCCVDDSMFEFMKIAGRPASVGLGGPRRARRLVMVMGGCSPNRTHARPRGPGQGLTQMRSSSGGRSSTKCSPRSRPSLGLPRLRQS